MWVQVRGLENSTLAVYDGGADVAVMSYRLYQQLEPRPELRESSDTIQGIFGPRHNPKGECTVQITIPELSVVVEYDVVVDDVEEDLLIDASMMHHAGIQLKYDSKELVRKGKIAKAVCRLNRQDNKARRLTLQRDWIIPPGTRQLVAGQVKGAKDLSCQHWIVEPSSLMAQDHSILVARSLCRLEQVGHTIPVEVYNPTDEPVQLYRHTTLGIISLVDEVTDVKLDASPSLRVGRTQRSIRSTEILPEELETLVEQSAQVLNPEQQDEFRALLREFRDVFATKDEPLGQTDVVFHDIKTEGKPIKTPYRRIPLGLRQEAVDEEQRMKDLGVIEPSESPWAAPVVLVRKKDQSLRYCIDYRRLNDVTQKDSYPLPNIQDCLDSLDGAKYFSSMDLCSGYWQVKLTEDAMDKTSFYGAGGGLWRFRVMPFGLCNAPATFERLMERVLGQLQWQILLCYLDDILIFSKTVSQHFNHLREVFLRLRKAHLKLKPKKCHFFQQQVSFLGHVVSEEGIMTDPEKIRKMRECPSPRNVHEVRSVVGLFSYYRRFIPHFSEIVKPLVKLTEKNQPFVWSETQEFAFQELKRRMMETPILVHPRMDGEFILDTDASNEGIGAVLSQLQDGEERVIAYASKALTKPERNYCVTRREMLAVVYFVTYFKHFLLGRRFTIRSDNSAVRYWTRIHSDTFEPKGQTARWLVKLGAYDFEIKHRPGRQHANADGLSRAPFVDCAQCDLRHQGGFQTKRNRTVAVVTRDGCTQTDGCMMKPRLKKDSRTRSSSDLKKPRRKVEGSIPRSHPLGDQAGQARIMTRSQRPKGQETTLSWMEGGVCLDKDVLRDEQCKDPASVDAMCWLKQGARPRREEVLALGLDHKFLWGNFEVLKLQEGLLCRVIGPLVDGTTRVTVYVPPSLRREIMSQCHDARTAGHFYYWKTLGRIKKNFFWGGMNKDVQVYCQACSICATRKVTGKKQRAEMRRYDVGYPMEEIAIDLAGPYPESSSGNKYVLVVVDSFSKWMEAYAIPNIEAQTVAEKLVLEFFSRFGVPMQIKTDQGRQFDCSLFEAMCEMLEVRHKMSTAFHPQGNSRVERMVKVVGNLVATFCRTYKEWDRNLPLLTLAYRSTVHEVTGFTPNYIMTGREVSLPMDVMLGSIKEQDRVTAPDYVQRLKSRMDACFSEVRTSLKEFGERQRKYYNLSTHGEMFKPGQVVYMREKTRKKQVSPKLAPKWKGPYLVVKRFGTVYEVMTTFRVTKLIHFDLLKPCYSAEVPSWIKKARRKFISEDQPMVESSGVKV